MEIATIVSNFVTPALEGLKNILQRFFPDYWELVLLLIGILAGWLLGKWEKLNKIILSIIIAVMFWIMVIK